MLKYVLFDLDGTLLPMDQDAFVKIYFKGLADKLKPYGLDTEKLLTSIWYGVSKMVKNDGLKLNEEVFWKAAEEQYGEDLTKYISIFDDYYKNEFDLTKKVCQKNEFIPEMIKKLKEKGLKLVIATNPIFPAIATEKRILWAGLDKQDFEFVTTYENSCSGKPNLIYYQEILKKINAKPDECLMVGNDAFEDMVARKLGIDVFLILDCLINSKNEDISTFNQGSFEMLVDYIDKKL